MGTSVVDGLRVSRHNRRPERRRASEHAMDVVAVTVVRGIFRAARTFCGHIEADHSIRRALRVGGQRLDPLPPAMWTNLVGLEDKWKDVFGTEEGNQLRSVVRKHITDSD